MFFYANDESVRYTGRWDQFEYDFPDGKKTWATSTNPGSMIEIAFRGKAAVLHFDITMNAYPFPHLWISLDNGTKIEVPVEKVIRVEAENEGEHKITMVYKSAVEMQHRWYAPLVGKIRFEGYEAENRGKLPEDNRKVIEFIGDSITEGVLIDEFYSFHQEGQLNRPYQDDSTATYAYFTAQKLNLKPYIIGYGAVGVTKSGCGSVPKAGKSYPYNFDGSKANPSGAEIIVINHGANDRYASSEDFRKGYFELLDAVRELNPESKIVLLTPFCCSHAEDFEPIAKCYNEKNNDNISVIDSSGWIPKDPLHPLRDGHITVSEHLAAELKKYL